MRRKDRQEPARSEKETKKGDRTKYKSQGQVESELRHSDIHHHTRSLDQSLSSYTVSDICLILISQLVKLSCIVHDIVQEMLSRNRNQTNPNKSEEERKIEKNGNERRER